MKKITIIVPVYNTKQYLKRCMDSLVFQTLNDIEIIVVDDASPDGSEIMIMEYANKYKDLIKPIIFKENVGHSSACNAALKQATGEYILFVDSDDWIELDACERLYKAGIENDADIVGADIYIDTEEKETIKCHEYYTCDLGVKNFENVYLFTLKSGLYFSKIYRRKLLKQYNICFPDGIFFYGDAFFNILVGLYAKNIIKQNFPFYHYYQHINQSTKKKNDNRSFDRIKVADKIVNVCKERGIYEQFKTIIDDKWFSLMMESAVTYFDKFDNANTELLYNICQQCTEYLPDYCTKCRSYLTEPWKTRMMFNLIMFSPKAAGIFYKSIWRPLKKLSSKFRK